MTFFRKMNKRGNNIHVFAFLFLLLMIGIGIVAGVSIFFGRQTDYRGIEAAILNFRIRECIEQNKGYLVSLNQAQEKDEAKWEIKRMEFYDKCELNSEVLERNNWARIVNDKNELIFYSGGDFAQCEIKGNINYPKCVTESLKLDGVSYEITTTSKQNSRRIIG